MYPKLSNPPSGRMPLIVVSKPQYGSRSRGRKTDSSTIQPRIAMRLQLCTPYRSLCIHKLASYVFAIDQYVVDLLYIIGSVLSASDSRVYTAVEKRGLE